MTAPKLTAALAKEYNDLFNRCEIAADKMTEVEGVVQRILDFQNRYAAIAAQSTVPWYVIAVIHNMECGLDFTKHLHNGDSLKRRTINVPAGRPKTGQPPFTFELSALDALEYDGFSAWSDWSGGICYKLEGYNDWGYRAHNINSPYLWSYSSREEALASHPQALASHPFRNDDFPQTYIQQISVSLDDPNHSLTLTWSGPNAASQDTGPFRTSHGDRWTLNPKQNKPTR